MARRPKMTPEERAWKSQAKRRAVKLEVYTHYCKGDVRCNRCPVVDIDVLNLHHIDGGGVEHRLTLFGFNVGGTPMYAWLKKHNFPDIKFESLCANCHTKLKFLEPRQIGTRKKGKLKMSKTKPDANAKPSPPKVIVKAQQFELFPGIVKPVAG